MPASLHFSNSLDALAERLIKNLNGPAVDPWATAAIATPASALRDWLKVRIAEKTGITANIAFSPLETLLWDRLAERDRHRENPERLPARLMDPFSFQGLVLARLRHEPPDALRAYLHSAHPEDAARRLVQLSGQMASLFREYEYNRVEEQGHRSLAQNWSRGETSFERHLLRGSAAHPARSHLAEVQALEAWQMEVYQALFREDGLRDQWGEAAKIYRYTLAQYAEMALQAPLTPVEAGRTYHLFGLSNISPFHRDLIGRLADSSKIGSAAAHFEIYALNPCAEYWEDLLSLRERRARGTRRLASGPVAPERVAATRPDEAELEAGELRDVQEENGLLALFGKPGRETIKLWCQLTEHDFLEDFREPLGASLLATVQAAVLHRTGPLAERTAPDASLRFRKASDPRAELEAVRAEIGDALKADPSLRPEEIAIIPAAPAAILPLLRAVFTGQDRTPGNVPVLLPDGGAAEEGPVLRGFRALLLLSSGEVTRDALLDLFENPAVQRAAGLETLRPSTVAELLEEIGFNRGWEGNTEGSASVEAALDRAVFSLALDGEDAALSGHAEFPRPVPGLSSRLDRGELGALLDWLDSLRTHLRPLRDGSARTYAEWTRLLRNLRDAFLAPDAQDARDARDALDLRRFLDEMEMWGAWGTGGAEGWAGNETADATLVAMLFADRFRGEDGTGRTHFLRGGVRTGNLAALRGIPFRRVWITGLSAEFPSTKDAIPLDLRAFRRLPGESDPAARDLYALLEVLVSCVESVSLSWPRRGSDGRERQPSRALTGLMAWLESDVIPEGVPFDFTELAAPLLPPPPRIATTLPTFVAGAAESAPRAVHKFNDLGWFLRNPVLHATHSLVRSNGRDVLDDREVGLSEDLFIDKWKGNAILDACLRAEILEPGSASATFGELWNARQRGGHLPPSPWGAIEEARLRGALEQRVSLEATSLRAILDATGLRFVGSLRLGPQGAERAEPPVLNLPAFDALPIGVDLRVGGVLPWFFQTPDDEDGVGGWAILMDEHRDMTAYLVQLCVTALAPPHGTLDDAFKGIGRVLVRAADGGEITECVLPEQEPEAARKILRALLGDFAGALRGEHHLDDVPLEAITEILDEAGGDPDAIANWADAITDLRREAEEAGHERITLRERTRRAIDPAIPENIEAVVHRRVLPYLRWKEALIARASEDATGRGADNGGNGVSVGEDAT